MVGIFYSEQELEYQRGARGFFETEAPRFIRTMEEKNEYPFDLLKKMGEPGI